MVENQIDNIEVFGKVNFKKLKNLNLNGNKISSVEVFTMVKFLDMDSLDLEYNQINNIEAFNNLPFNSLKHLGLRNNNFDKKDEKILKIKSSLEKKFEGIDVVVGQPERGPLGC